jgi:hypothetical protein
VPRLTSFLRVVVLSIVPACAAGEADDGRPILPSATGVHFDESSTGGSSSGSSSSSGGSSTGDVEADASSSSSGEGSTSAALLEETSTGADPGDGSSGGSSSTGDVELGTSTGEDSSSGGGDESSSTGEPEPEPAVCGDGVCEPSERAACWAWDNGWADKFCWPDCGKDPACLAEVDCPCTPGAAAIKNWCGAEPAVACSVTMPGGLCSQPQGDAPVFYMWTSKCFVEP